MADYKSINTRLVQSFINDAKENKDVSNLKVVVDKIAETDFFLTSFAAVSRGYLTIFADIFHIDAPEPTPTNPEVTERTDALTKAYFDDHLDVCLDSVATYGDMEQRQEGLKQILKLLKVALTHVATNVVPPHPTYFQNVSITPGTYAPMSPIAPRREGDDEADEEQEMPELVRENEAGENEAGGNEAGGNEAGGNEAGEVCENCGEIHPTLAASS